MIMAVFASAIFLYLSPSFMAYIGDITMDALLMARDLIYFSLAISLERGALFHAFLI